MTSNVTQLGYVNIKNETIFEVGKFAILWNIFERFNCNFNCTCNKIIEMEKSLESLDKKPFEEFVAILKTRACERRLNIDDYVNNNIYPANGARINQNDRTRYIPLVIDFINSNGEKSLTGALLAIYRIRNNMFHGLKGYNELEEQIGLFKAMNTVLEEVIK
jgi:hypothetical protein